MEFGENRWRRNIFLICGNQKNSLDGKSGLCCGWPINLTFWRVKKALIWADVWELVLSWCTMIRLLLLVFRITPKLLWCTTHNWPCNVAQVEQSPHDQFCRRNRRPSASKCFYHKQLLLDLVVLEGPHGGLLFCFGLMRRYMLCHLWRSYKRLLKHRHRSFPTFLRTNRQEPFLSDCGNQWEQKFFTARCSWNIQCILVGQMPKNSSISRNITWRSCIISSATIDLIKPVFHSAIRWCYIAIQKFKFIKLN